MSAPSLHRMRTHSGQKQKVWNRFPSSGSQTGKLRSRSVASGDLSSDNGAQRWGSETVLQVSNALLAVTGERNKSQSPKAFVTKRRVRATTHLYLLFFPRIHFVSLLYVVPRCKLMPTPQCLAKANLSCCLCLFKC